jgi:SAM-dependent methyltransferase
MMTKDNAEQIAEWNGVQGERWATLRQETNRIVTPFGEAALAAAAPGTGERVIDVGCGCGDTSIDLARRVGAAGSVLGVDVSAPMLDVARALGAELPHLAFRECDAASAALPAGTDLLYSRFGVMFFADPPAAFAHMRSALRPGGRCVFACWRAPRDNAWTMVPISAARAALGITPPPADPNAPGPFAFADDGRVRGILEAAGFGAINVERFDASVVLGATPRAAAEAMTRIGPVARMVREVGVEHQPTVAAAVEKALVSYAAPDGPVTLQGSAWIVTAANP